MLVFINIGNIFYIVLSFPNFPDIVIIRCYPCQKWVCFNPCSRRLGKITDKNRIGSASFKIKDLWAPGLHHEAVLQNDRFSEALTQTTITVRCVAQRQGSPASKANDLTSQFNPSTHKPKILTTTIATDLLRESGLLSRWGIDLHLLGLIDTMKFGRSSKRYFSDRRLHYICLFYDGEDTLFWTAEHDRNRLKNSTRSMRLSSITSIVKGTDYFPKPVPRIRGDTCLTLIGSTGGRVNILNLEAAHSNQRDTWLYGVLYMVKTIGGDLPREMPLNIVEAPEDPLPRVVSSPNSKPSSPKLKRSSVVSDRS